MGRINDGISGGFSGKVGTVVGGKWNGIDYMRSRVANFKDAKSTAQQNQRARFLTVVQFLSPLKDFLPMGFKSRAVHMSSYNAATSYHLEMAITGTFPDFGIDYSKVKVSLGKLPGALNPAAVSISANEIGFTWDNNSAKVGAMANDNAVLLVYNPIKQNALWVVSGQTRIGGGQTITLPASFSGDEVHCYLSFQKANQTVISDSQFVGSVIVK
jgi:hypothetical protein